MAGEYKAPCGCKIHVAQWTAKRKVVSQESCAVHKHARELLRAAEAILPDLWEENFEREQETDYERRVVALRAAILRSQGQE
jgi:hypothetical protein